MCTNECITVLVFYFHMINKNTNKNSDFFTLTNFLVPNVLPAALYVVMKFHKSCFKNYIS